MSAGKLSFKVVYCSGESESYPVSELEVHTPHTKGWRTPRFCDYPQEIGLSFGALARLRKVQLYSHQYLIATRVELFVGNVPKGSAVTYANARFQRLGYLSLDANKRTEYSARELKSVHIDAIGHFLKLVIAKCHVNKYNLYNQVGLIAINCLGGPVDMAGEGAVPLQLPDVTTVPDSEFASTLSNTNNANPALWGLINRVESTDPMDDVTFGLGFDPVTAAILKDLKAEKEAAEASEDYETCKRVKKRMAYLVEVGGELAKLEARKKSAVDRELYDEAQLIKAEIDELRAASGTETSRMAGRGGDGGGQKSARSDVSLPHSEAMFVPNDSRSVSIPAIPPHLLRAPAAAPAPAAEPQEPPERPARKTAPPPAAAPPSDDEDDTAPQREVPYAGDPADRPINGAKEAQAKAAFFEVDGESGPSADTAAADAEEAAQAAQIRRQVAIANRQKARSSESGSQPVPALRRGAGNGAAAASAAVAASSGGETLGDAEALAPAVAAQVAHLNEQFGEDLLKGLYSKKWLLRQQALEALPSRLGGADSSAILAAATEVLVVGVADSLPQVFTTALATLDVVLNAFERRVSEGELRGALREILPELVEKTGDTQPRFKDAATDALVSIAARRALGPTVLAPLLLRQEKNPNKWRPALGRIDVLRALVSAHGVGAKSGLPLEGVMAVVADALGNPNKRLRDAGVATAVEVHRAAGDAMFEGLAEVEQRMVDVVREAVGAAPGGAAGATAGRGRGRERSPSPVGRRGRSPSPPPGGAGAAGRGRGAARGGRGRGAGGPARGGRGGAAGRGGRGGGVAGGGGGGAANEEYSYYSDDSIDPPQQAPPRRDGRRRSPERSPPRELNININVRSDGVAAATVGPDSPTRPEAGPAAGGGRAVSLQRPRMRDGGGPGDLVLTPEKHVSASAHAVNQEIFTNEWNIDHTCIFCGVKDPTFDKQKLDVHYFRDCAMLTSCPACKETVEVASLAEHLADECDKSASFKPCPRCREPIRNTDYPSHVAGRQCHVAKDPAKFSRCPLCHDDIPPGEAGWTRHLMVDKCPANDRTRKR